MNYKDMIETARKAGLTNEAKMWESVESFDVLLRTLEVDHPELYWDFMRAQHGRIYGGHYTRDFADLDVSEICYTDRDGEKHTGPHWTADEIERATNAYSFPSGTTKCDKYVAFNAAYADFCKDFDDVQILQIGYRFFFDDEDWPTSTKIWDYIALRNKL